MSHLLQEHVTCEGIAVRADLAAGVLRGVKIIGLKSRNARRYLPEALLRAVALYEGAKVNVNHPKGDPLSPRDYQDRIGALRDVEMRAGEGLFADFHFNPKHALAEQLAWDAEHTPQNVGFSHNVLARTSRDGATTVVEEIERVQSVDLVADPAATSGLFEQIEADAESVLLSTLTLERLEASRSDLVEAIETRAGEKVRAELAPLAAELEKLRASQCEQHRRARIIAALGRRGLPDPWNVLPGDRRLVPALLVEALESAESDAEVERLVAEHVRLLVDAKNWRPHCEQTGGPTIVARDQTLVDSASRLDAQSFVRAITS